MSSTTQFKKHAWYRQADWLQWTHLMKQQKKMGRPLYPPMLTRTRIIAALAAAIVADGLQLSLGPIGWAFGDPVIDVVAMLLTSWLLGFHWLLLPTFILEFVPVADELPTWTACVIAVVVLRKRQQQKATPSPSEGPVIDV